jgi:peroxiredoxin
MMISNGESLPKFRYKDRVAGEFVTIDLQSEIKGKKVVIFGLPGAFTPTCSSQQLPGFEMLFSKFVEAGIDTIYCTSVNDPFVMNSWFDAQGVENVRSLPDGNGDFAAQLGLLVQKRNLNFGMRSWRYAMVVDGDTNTVTAFFPEEGFANDVEGDPYEASKPEAVLKWVKENL